MTENNSKDLLKVIDKLRQEWSDTSKELKGDKSKFFCSGYLYCLDTMEMFIEALDKDPVQEYLLKISEEIDKSSCTGINLDKGDR